MIEFVLLSVVSALYVLGTYQGSAIADFLEEHFGVQMAAQERFLYRWLWPYIVVLAMLAAEDEE